MHQNYTRDSVVTVTYSYRCASRRVQVHNGGREEEEGYRWRKGNDEEENGAKRDGNG